MPHGLNSQSALWAGLADRSLGNHASGTPSTRLSVNVTHNVSASLLTDLGEILMPSPFQLVAMGLNKYGEPSQRPGVEAVVTGQTPFGQQPELRFCAGLTNMNMGRL